MDFLVQRYIENAPNEDSGAWVDVEIIRDLKADEAVKGAEKAGVTGRVRVTRWDTTEEFTAEPGPPVVARVSKATDS